MKHEPDWEQVDIKQVERREQELAVGDGVTDDTAAVQAAMDMRVDRSDNELDYNNADIPWQHLNKPRHDYDNHAEYDDAQLPAYARDPEYLDDLRDPLRAAEGIFNMIIIAVLFWGTLIALVWLANRYL